MQILQQAMCSWAGVPADTHTVLSWPASSRPVAVPPRLGRASHSPQTRALSFDTPQLLSPLCLHRGMPGSTPTCTPIHSTGGGPHAAAWAYNTAAAAAAAAAAAMALR